MRNMFKNIKSHALPLVLFIDDAAALVLVFIILWLFDIRIPLPLAVVIALLFGTLAFVTHKAVIPALHKKKTTGPEGMIGLKGTVIQPLTPLGVIKFGSEYWKAKSVGDDIDTDEEVEILRLDGLTLVVRLTEQQDVG